MSRLTQSLAGGMACAILAGHAYALSPAEIFDRASRSVMVVRGLNANESPLQQGSGVVADNKTVITSCRILAKAKLVQVRQGGISYQARLEHADIDRDLCQLNVPDLQAPPAPPAPPATELKVGQRVFAIGSAAGFSLTMRDALVYGIRNAPVAENTSPIELSTSVARETLGGGLFDENGALVGIVAVATGKTVSHGQAAPASWIKEIPARAIEKLAIAAKQTPKTEASNPVKTPDPLINAAELRQLAMINTSFVVGGKGTELIIESNGWWSVPQTSDRFAPRGYWTVHDDGTICLTQNVLPAFGDFSGCYLATRAANGPVILAQKEGKR